MWVMWQRIALETEPGLTKRTRSWRGHPAGRVLVTRGRVHRLTGQATVREGRAIRVVDNLATGHRLNLAHLEGRSSGSSDLRLGFETAKGRRRSDRGSARRPSRRPRSVVEPRSVARQQAELPRRSTFWKPPDSPAARRCLRRFEQHMATPTTCPSTEDGTAPQPYAAGKLAGEQYIRGAPRTSRGSTVSASATSTSCSGQDPSSPYSGVISLFARLMAEGRRPTIYGDGSQTRDFTYVENVVRANLMA